MRIQVKYKTDKGGWAFLKCSCCLLRREFSSFNQATVYCRSNQIYAYKAMRV